MSLDRALIIQGPAIVTYKSQTIGTVGDITATPNISRFEIDSSLKGKLDERFTQVVWDITFQPLGTWSTALLAVLFPYADPTYGESILGSGSDDDVVVHGQDGTKVTFHNAAVTRMPSVNFSTKAVLFGDMTISAIGKNDTEWSNANKFFTSASEAFPGFACDPADVLTDLYSHAWGASSPWDDFDTEAGLQIDWSLNIQQRTADACGVVDLILQGLTAEAKAVPMGPTDAEVRTALGIQGTGARPGASLNASSNDLVISSDNVSATLYAAALTNAPSVWSRENLRNGEVVWTATRGYTAGPPAAMDPVFAFAEAGA